jgi:hypothetical protein
MAAELMAIYKALELIEEQTEGENIIVCSDSKSSLQLISSRTGTYSDVVDKIRNLLILVNTGRNVVLQWVKAHAGIAGNEIADATAKQGHNADRSLLFPLAKEEHYNLLQRTSRTSWDEDWKQEMDLTMKGLHLGHIKDNFAEVPWIRSRKRRIEVVLSRLRIGHVGLNQYLHRFKMLQSDQCVACRVPETIEHFLLHCRYYHQQRQEMERQLRLINVRHHTMKLLLGGSALERNKQFKIVNIVSGFLTSSGRLDTL